MLITFAALLRRHCRSGDLVARYGGEEFVMLCADCDNATATRRAEELRVEVAEFPMAALEGKCISASFGVTEVQSGDTPETMLRRADRALYQAKSNGRNTVVQLGSGIGGERSRRQARRLVLLAPADAARAGAGADAGHERAVQRRRRKDARLCGRPSRPDRRRSPKTTWCSRSKASRRRCCGGSPTGPCRSSSRCGSKNRRAVAEPAAAARWCGRSIHVTIRPQRSRDRRRRDVLERAQRLAASLKSYLIAQDHDRQGD